MPMEVCSADAEKAYEALQALKQEGYNVLVDMTAIDYSAYPEKRAARFDVVYRLANLNAETGLEEKPRIEVHCAVNEEPVLRSSADLWPDADWLEREIWDMFGIRFSDRPDIKRLLLYEQFVGHPLRKDYPIAKRQPLIGPASGERDDSPSFNIVRPTIKYE